MGNDCRDRIEECFERADYDGHVKYAKIQYQKTQSEEDRKIYEKAIENRELYREMQKIINSDHEDYYSILDVCEKTQIADIKKSFRKLAFKYHPNKTRVEGATEAMRIIQKAYFEINTEEKKAAYDRKRMASSFSGFEGGMHTSGPSSFEQEIFRRFRSAHGFGVHMNAQPIYASPIINEIFRDPYSSGDVYRYIYNNSVYRRNGSGRIRGSHLWELGVACLIQLIIIYIAFSCFF